MKTTETRTDKPNPVRRFYLLKALGVSGANVLPPLKGRELTVRELEAIAGQHGVDTSREALGLLKGEHHGDL